MMQAAIENRQKFLKKLHTELPCDPAILILHRTKRIENRCSRKYVYMTIDSTTTCNRQKIETTPNVYQLMSQMWSIPAMGYYSAIKMTDVWIHGTIWLKLESTLSERIQTKKATSFMIALYEMFRIGKSKDGM